MFCPGPHWNCQFDPVLGFGVFAHDIDGRTKDDILKVTEIG
jgi:hypothetical protein